MSVENGRFRWWSNSDELCKCLWKFVDLGLKGGIFGGFSVLGDEMKTPENVQEEIQRFSHVWAGEVALTGDVRAPRLFSKGNPDWSMMVTPGRLGQSQPSTVAHRLVRLSWGSEAHPPTMIAPHSPSPFNLSVPLSPASHGPVHTVPLESLKTAPFFSPLRFFGYRFWPKLFEFPLFSSTPFEYTPWPPTTHQFTHRFSESWEPPQLSFSVVNILTILLYIYI